MHHCHHSRLFLPFFFLGKVPQREDISHHTSAATAVESKFLQQTLPSHRTSTTTSPPSVTDQQPWAEEKNELEFIQIWITHENPIFQATVPKQHPLWEELAN